jgi:MFS family permease
MPESPRRDRPGETPGRAASAGDFLVCLIATAAWAARALPGLLTHLRDAYDAQSQAWEIAWVRHAIVHAPAHIFDANIFAPARNALAFTEPLIGYGIAGLPLGYAGFSEPGVFNVLCLLGTAFSVWAISRLAVSHGAPRLPALLGAFAAALGAQTACAFGYVSFVVAGGIALVLVAWKRLRESGRWRVAFALGAAIAALGWFSLHLLAFGLAALFAIVALDAATKAETRRLALLARLAAALVLAALLLAPLARHMLEARRDYGFHRDETESRFYSATPRDWLTTTSVNPGQAFLKWRSDSERSLYPGTAALVLSAAGILGLLLTRKNAGLIAAGAVLAGLGIVGSFGPAGPAVPVLTIAFPFVFSGIRAFTRFGCVAQIGFGLLAGAGCAALLERTRSRGARAALAAALAVGIAADVRQTVRFGFRPELPHPPAEEFLARSDTGGPILHLPLTHSPGDVRWTFSSLAHFKPIVNGYASYLPRRNQELAATLASEKIPETTLSLLADWPVGALVVHEHALPLDRLRPTMELAAAGLQEGALDGPRRFDHRGGDDWVFFLRRASGRPPAPAAGGAAEKDVALFIEHVVAAPRFGQFEDTQFPASIDEPSAGQVVHGELKVRGWSQTPGARGEIVEIRIDRDARARAFFARTPRPDVAAVLPALGSCAEAGYEARFPMLPGDDGTHDLRVVFRAVDGRMRTISITFEWAR